MAFTKITSHELNQRGATTLPNQPTISSTALKEEFDAPAKQIVAPKFNNLIDELEAAEGASSLGATAPTGRTGATVQALIDDISGDLATVEASIPSLVADEHTHANKALLDTYEQTETDLADAVSKKHAHENKALLDTYTQTESDLADAVSKKHSHSNKALLDTYTQTESDLADAVTKKHAHTNKTELDKFTESDGKILYGSKNVNGSIDNSVAKVKVGNNTITASGEDTVEFVAGSNVTLVANESNKTVTISSTGGGGGGGGDMYKSEYATNGVTGRVDEAASINDGTNSYTPTQLKTAIDGKMSSSADIDDLSDVQITSAADGQLLTYNSVNSRWENKAPDKSYVRYGGAKTFAELTSSLLIADNEDKFFLCTDGGTIASADIGNWTGQFDPGDVIPPDSHIAVINVSTTSTPDYRFDDFGGYVDISGKADKTDLPIVLTRTGVTVSAGSFVYFPETGSDPSIKADSTIIPLCSPSSPIKYSQIDVESYSGFVRLTVAQDISNATLGILVINN